MSNNTFGFILDTSTEKPFLLFSLEGKPLYFYQQSAGHKNFTYQLLFEIHKFCKDQSFALKDLSYIAVGKGPGSYTGIRAGVAVAQGLCFGLKIPLLSFDSLQSYLPTHEGKFFSAHFASTRGVYLLEGKRTTADVQWQESFFSSHEDFPQFVKKTDLLCTPHPEQMKNCYPEYSIEEAKIETSFLCQFCFSLYRNKQYSPKPHVDILYRDQKEKSTC